MRQSAGRDTSISTNSITCVSKSPEETWDIARTLVDSLPQSAVIALHGDLGAGKTCFVHGLAMALGIEKPVTSPTFTVINEYRGPARNLNHIDLYRLNSFPEIQAIGFEDYTSGPGITAVEWAERAGDLIPPGAIHVSITTGKDPDERMIIISKKGNEK
ncbi:MAG: tRNA (adenosine(37)-N6)-threonylcarbamoyltransferase complex ATPase subunit type 1 TsaE [Verrucomicrobia bacterium]|nr:tRNA (adenosine(37)-N6)-threonylcarbamoyltransferase complex ATPase subunit type 1 TsaE [Verrucomicrobiota bacterium]